MVTVKALTSDEFELLENDIRDIMLLYGNSMECEYESEMDASAVSFKLYKNQRQSGMIYF